MRFVAASAQLSCRRLVLALKLPNRLVRCNDHGLVVRDPNTAVLIPIQCQCKHFLKNRLRPFRCFSNSLLKLFQINERIVVCRITYYLDIGAFFMELNKRNFLNFSPLFFFLRLAQHFISNSSQANSCIRLYLQSIPCSSVAEKKIELSVLATENYRILFLPAHPIK